MDLDFEDLITQSIITNSDSRRVSVKTTQSREYDLVYKDDSTFDIKVKKDGFICDECGEIYEEEHELTDHKRLQKCRRKYKTKAELKEIPFENDVNKFLQINISTYNEITDDEHHHDDSDHTPESRETDDHPQQLEEESSDAQNAEFTCAECGRVCASKIGLVTHSRSHRAKRGRKT